MQRVADRLPATEWGVRAAGDPERMVQRVAVSSGAGGQSPGGRAKALGCGRVCDLGICATTPVDEALRDGGPTIIDTAHWASEFPWCEQAAELVAREASVEVEVLNIRTDPWTISAHPTHTESTRS